MREGFELCCRSGGNVNGKPVKILRFPGGREGGSEVGKKRDEPTNGGRGGREATTGTRCSRLDQLDGWVDGWISCDGLPFFAFLAVSPRFARRGAGFSSLPRSIQSRRDRFRPAGAVKRPRPEPLTFPFTLPRRTTAKGTVPARRFVVLPV